MATVPNLPMTGTQLHDTLSEMNGEAAVLQAAMADKADAGDIPDIRVFDTDAEAEAYAAADPGAIVFSREGAA